jgi:hypothetical protein
VKEWMDLLITDSNLLVVVLEGSVSAIKSLYDFKRTDAVWIRLTNLDYDLLITISFEQRAPSVKLQAVKKI